MKVNNFLKTILITLIVVGISIISFLGIFVEDKNTMKNLMPEYILGKDLNGYRRVELEVKKDDTTTDNSTENEVDEVDTQIEEVATVEESEDKVLNLNNYNETKKIIEKRLKQMGIIDYTISLDTDTGKIVVELPEDDLTDTAVYELMYQGKFEITDNDTNEVLMTNDDLKDVKSGYGTTSSGATSIFVNFEFNKEGTEKFKNITNTYVETTVEKEQTEGETETNKEEESTTLKENSEETETLTREIVIKIDGEELLTTHFDNEISNGILQLSFGTSTSLSTEKLQERLIEANNMSILLSSGKTPVEYEVTQNRYIFSDITSNEINMIVYICIAVLVIAIIYLVVRYRVLGIKASISLIGYIALLLICIRIFNVEVGISGIFAIILNIILSFALIENILRNNKKQQNIKSAISETIIKYSIILAPACIISIVLTMFNISIGAVLFWGIIINILYNLSVMRILLVNKK